MSKFPVATATDRVPAAKAQATSFGVSPTTNTSFTVNEGTPLSTARSKATGTR